MTFECFSYGDQAIRVVFGDEINGDITEKVRLFCYSLKNERIIEIIEWVPSFTAVTIYFDPVQTDANQMINKMKSLSEKSVSGTLPRVRVYEIPVCYGGDLGPDIKNVAGMNKMMEEEVIHLHTGRDYLVHMIGFTPGFPYLGGMDKSIAAPRLETPRALVKAGSVGIAGSQTGMYSIESPGGWNIIGRSPVKLFDIKRDSPSLLKAGDYVRFYSVDLKSYHEMKNKSGEGHYKPDWQEWEVNDVHKH